MTENNTLISNFKKNINIKDLVFECIKKWYIIVATVAFALMLTLIYTFLILTPMYSSTAKIMIFNKQETTALEDLELSSSIYLARDFTEIINDKFVLDSVAKELNNKYTVSQLKSFITLNNPTSTRIIEINALSPNAEDSKKIVDSICNISQEKIVELMGLDRITTISYGEISTRNSTPNSQQNLTIGIVLGLIIGVSIVTLIYVMDNKISTTQDVEKYVGLSVLATIPYNNKQTAKR